MSNHSMRFCFRVISLLACLGAALPASFARADTCDAGLAAFKTSVFNMVRTNCTHCHETGLHGAPLFAVSDVNASYSRIQTYVNFADIPNSYFVQRGGSMHCLSDYGFDCKTNHADVQAQVQAWWDGGEKTCPSKGKYLTNPQAMPSPLPERNQGFATMRWDLSPIGAALSGSWFEIQVQRFAEPTATTPGAYRFRAPRLAAVGSDLEVKDIKVLVNGKYDNHSNEYTFLDRVVAAQPMPTDPKALLPYPVLSTQETIIVDEGSGKGDLVSIGFGDLLEAKAATCAHVDVFSSKVMPTVTARNCAGCHAGTEAANIPAKQRWNMGGSPAQLCSDFLARTDALDPEGSAVIALPFQGALDHPRIIPSYAEIAPWLDWIQAESTH